MRLFAPHSLAASAATTAFTPGNYCIDPGCWASTVAKPSRPGGTSRTNIDQRHYIAKPRSLSRIEKPHPKDRLTPTIRTICTARPSGRGQSRRSPLRVGRGASCSWQAAACAGSCPSTGEISDARGGFLDENDRRRHSVRPAGSEELVRSAVQ